MYRVYLIISISATFIKCCHDDGLPMETFKLIRLQYLYMIKHAYIFGKVVITTATCIFNVIIKKAPHWRHLGELCMLLMR